MRERPGLPVASDRAVHEPRIERCKRLVSEPEALHHAGTEALDEHVVTRDEPQQRSARFRLLQVEYDAAFAAIERVKHCVHAANLWGHDAQIVAACRVLDLVDLRSEIREHHRRERAGQES